MMRLAPLPPDDGPRILRPAPPGIDDFATHGEPADLDHLLEESGQANHLVRRVEILGDQVHARIIRCRSKAGQGPGPATDMRSGMPRFGGVEQRVVL